ncbi:hypothetical protein RclHR1_00480004 [Rhizophagus clarus]|uniref:F-box domain-containing protein n=1 Tax=Rhizophagus clarus TaxID=94130 RepID=A0A2Z6SCM9_9GLOM|nr:hypothetical protein RclHR1_00480004 [Rhizophagus clarus]GET00446.1 hypothetical protein GLOIN_2v1784405 [Rhizophagus clarus]
MLQLPAECLNEILEYFKEDQKTLRSCLLVNRLLCKISVRLLWRDVWDYNISNYDTLITCLPNKSKEILSKNGIITSITKYPMFNYASFCKVLSINRIYNKVEQLLLSKKHIVSRNLNEKTLIVAQEICKLFMNQVRSLTELGFYGHTSEVILTSYPGAKDCLKNLSELNCSSNISSEFLYQLSEICHSIKSLNITFEEVNSNGLSDLISVQKNLKCLSIKQQAQYRRDNKANDIIPLFTSKHYNTLTKLILCGNYDVSLSFVAEFKNLQELELSFDHNDYEDFERLQHVTFLNLQILKIPYIFVSYDLLITFLRNNGNNLREFYVGDGEGYSDNSLNLAIAKFCPKLRKLSTGFKNNEIETLKMVFKNCYYLESIKLWCGGEYLSEKDALESVVKYSHENLYELLLCHKYYTQSELLSEELDSFFINWIDRKPQRLISLIIVNDDAISLDTDENNMEIIERYKKLGVVKFDIKYHEDDDYS